MVEFQELLYILCLMVSLPLILGSKGNPLMIAGGVAIIIIGFLMPPLPWS